MLDKIIPSAQHIKSLRAFRNGDFLDEDDRGASKE